MSVELFNNSLLEGISPQKLIGYLFLNKLIILLCFKKCMGFEFTCVHALLV